MLKAFLLAAGLQSSTFPAELPADLIGEWRATLASPGGELPFALVLDVAGKARIENGPERIEVTEVRWVDGELVLGFPHYDASIRARPDGGGLAGRWQKRPGSGSAVELPFRATRGAAPRFPPEQDAAGSAGSVAGRWNVRFARSENPAVGVFEQEGTAVTGTFLTTTGDHRYLAGSFEGGRLRLSCFDGTHAFLFDARLGEKGLAGRFHSGAAWTEDWTAERDEAAALPDAWGLTQWDERLPLPLYVFPDLHGQARSLGEWQTTARGLVLVLMGSWCPNCHDEVRDLAELDRKLRPRGLVTLGLAFEQGDDPARDAEQVRRMLLRHKAAFPVLLAGRSDKRRAAEALPGLSGVHAFPTTIFLHRDGRVRRIHTGYSGPGTGAAHAEVKREFAALAQELLDEPDVDATPRIARMTSGRWIDVPNYFTTTIFQDGRGGRFISDDPAYLTEDLAQPAVKGIVLAGPSMWFDDRLFAWDAETSVFLDPFDAGHRLVAESIVRADPPEPSWTVQPEQIDESGRSKLARVRREALFVSVRAARQGKRAAPLDPLVFLDDPDVSVRCVAAWVAGEMKVEKALPKLLANADHGFGPLRREVARALGRLKAKESRPVLEKLARDADPLVRQRAQWASGELGH